MVKGFGAGVSLSLVSSLYLLVRVVRRALSVYLVLFRWVEVYRGCECFTLIWSGGKACFEHLLTW